MTNLIEDDVRAALRAAAAGIEIPVDRTPGAGPGNARPDRRRRWLPVLAAVAVVAALGVATPLVLSRGTSMTTTPGLQVGEGRAIVRDVSIPIPKGWTAELNHESADGVVVCLASHHDEDCSAGVRVRISEVGRGSDRIPLDDCQWWIRQDAPQLLGDRPATAVSVGCGATEFTGPKALVWYTQRVRVSTPLGAAHAEGRLIAEGIRFPDDFQDAPPESTSVSQATATDAQSAPSGEPVVPQVPQPPGAPWSTNASGQTLGIWDGPLRAPEAPDLIYVATQEGGNGYVNAQELANAVGETRTPEEAVAFGESVAARCAAGERWVLLSAFDTDGVTQVGTFLVGLDC